MIRNAIYALVALNVDCLSHTFASNAQMEIYLLLTIEPALNLFLFALTTTILLLGMIGLAIIVELDLLGAKQIWPVLYAQKLYLTAMIAGIMEPAQCALMAILKALTTTNVYLAPYLDA